MKVIHDDNQRANRPGAGPSDFLHDPPFAARNP